MLCFVICWLPFEIINVIILVDKGVTTCLVEIIDTVACWLAYLHSSLNPLLYAFASSEFRHAFRKLLCKREEWTSNLQARMTIKHNITKESFEQFTERVLRALNIISIEEVDKFILSMARRIEAVLTELSYIRSAVRETCKTCRISIYGYEKQTIKQTNKQQLSAYYAV